VATYIFTRGQMATYIKYEWPIGHVYLLHVVKWPRVLNTRGHLATRILYTRGQLFLIIYIYIYIYIYDKKYI
jgi:hypothetical protein